MVAEATIRGDRTVSMVTLPGDAVVRDPQGATQVYVYYPDQKRVYAKRVEIGAAVNKDVEIKSGLEGRELIVLAGQTKLRNGLTVSATRTDGSEIKRNSERINSMKPIKFSLRYPAVTLILTAMVVMVGIHAFLKMQRTEDPTHHHQDRAGGRDVSGSDLRAGGKAGNQDP